MATLRDSKTHDNLEHVFAGESQANRRYLYFARRADIEGSPEIGDPLRDTTPRLPVANRFCFGSAPSCGYMLKIEWPDLLPTEDCKFVAAP
jgi:hypothetical protein